MHHLCKYRLQPTLTGGGSCPDALILAASCCGDVQAYFGPTQPAASRAFECILVCHCKNENLAMCYLDNWFSKTHLTFHCRMVSISHSAL